MFIKSKYVLILLLVPVLIDAQSPALPYNNSPVNQTQDSTPQFSLKKVALPASLILAGSLMSGSRFEKSLLTDIRKSVGNDFQFKIDNYLQYAPIVEMYTADIAGVKAKNHWFDQTKNLFISDLATGTLVLFLKKITNKTRPNGAQYSFPSGHTSLAFSNAGVLYQEYRDTSPILAYSGFGMAITTGAFRMFNNKHWPSDVIAGAGIGILVSQLVCHLEPLKNWNPFKNTKEVSCVPIIDEKEYGIYARIAL